MSVMSTIRSSRYDENEAKLREDKFIQEMVDELVMDDVPLEKISHPDGHPNHQFMMNALDEYHRRGGTQTEHIGGPANAILALYKERIAAREKPYLDELAAREASEPDPPDNYGGPSSDTRHKEGV